MKRWSRVAISLVVAAGLVGLAATTIQAQTKGDPAAGEPLYKKSCASCHGTTGANGPAAAKMKDKPNDWTKGEGLTGMDDQKLFDSIKKGGAAVGKAKTMPAYPKLSDAEVWNLVAYVKTLGKSS